MSERPTYREELDEVLSPDCPARAIEEAYWAVSPEEPFYLAEKVEDTLEEIGATDADKIKHAREELFNLTPVANNIFLPEEDIAFGDILLEACIARVISGACVYFSASDKALKEALHTDPNANDEDIVDDDDITSFTPAEQEAIEQAQRIDKTNKNLHRYITICGSLGLNPATQEPWTLKEAAEHEYRTGSNPLKPRRPDAAGHQPENT